LAKQWHVSSRGGGGNGDKNLGPRQRKTAPVRENREMREKKKGWDFAAERKADLEKKPDRVNAACQSFGKGKEKVYRVFKSRKTRLRKKTKNLREGSVARANGTAKKKNIVGGIGRGYGGTGNTRNKKKGKRIKVKKTTPQTRNDAFGGN